MDHLLHFKPAYELISSIDSVMMKNVTDNISYSFSKSPFYANTTFKLLNNKDIHLSINGGMTYKSTNLFANIDSMPSAYIAASRKCMDNTLKLNVSLSTPLYVQPKISPIYSKCFATIQGIYKAESFKATGFAGFKYNNAISTLCTFEIEPIQLSLSSLISEKSSIIEASALSQLGPFFTFATDLYSMEISQANFGAIKSIPNGTGYVIIELKNPKLTYGFISNEISRVRFASEGSYSRTGSIECDIGLSVERVGEFKGKLNMDGELSMLSTFSPYDWLTVTLRTKSSTTTKFQNLTFGWSLAIKHEM